ncbi:MAG TPA: TonB family protein [Burkholderiales bacterium]|nr:TonB family protein [Burkholderiales bacterium]
MSADRRNRVFHYALVASLALHALLFLSVPDFLDRAQRAAASVPPIIARLMAPEPAPAPPVAPAVEPPPPEKPKKKPAPPAVMAKPAPAPLPAPAAVPALPPPVAAAPAAPASPPPAPAVPAPPGPVASSPAVPDEQSADRYRMELIAALARMIKDSYPQQARDNNWEGDVLLGVVVRANGSVAISVKRSSRFRVLDAGAVAALRQAVQEVPVPPTLRGRDAPLKDLMVQYRLED